MRRAPVITAVVFGGFLFLGLSLLGARALTGAGNERSQVLEVLQAQARGDADAVLEHLEECSREPACARTARDRVARLKRPGEVEILTYRPSVRVAVTERLGTGRVAWRAGASLPVVQCVRVLREGPLAGGGAELLAISDPIGRESSCP